MNKEYVDNDVWKYRVSLKLEGKDIVIYTKPFPEMPLYKTDKEYQNEIDRRKDLVQERYFTKERIKDLKQDFIKRIQECENPFYICCVDKDSGYNVTEDDLFNLE